VAADGQEGLGWVRPVASFHLVLLLAGREALAGRQDNREIVVVVFLLLLLYMANLTEEEKKGNGAPNQWHKW